jgi:tetratricopeptide (TPR) repeat protein
VTLLSLEYIHHLSTGCSSFSASQIFFYDNVNILHDKQMLLIPYSLLIISITVSLVTFPNVFAQNKSVDFNALVNKGLALDNLGNHTVALQYFDKALAIQPNNFNVLYNKGVTLYDLGNYTEAIKYYDKALAIQPNNFDVLYNKANALAKLGSSISPSSPGSMTPPSGSPPESIPGLLPITTNNTQ